MKSFLFITIKKLLFYWASRLLKAESVTDILITVAESHAKNTKTKTDDKLVEVIKTHLNQ